MSIQIRRNNYFKKAERIHKDKFSYNKDSYIHSKKKIEIFCPEHGSFWQRPDLHLSGKGGCRGCNPISDYTFKKGHRPANTHNQDDFINKCIEVHGNRYDYSMVIYKNSTSKVQIICPEHGSFWQRASDHKNGCGCPKCCESKGEARVRTYLEENKISFKQEYSFSKLGLYRFDFYLEEYNLCIEYDGRQHFEEVACWEPLSEVQKRDEIKNNYCKHEGIDLIRIPFTKFKLIKEILDNKLKELK